MFVSSSFLVPDLEHRLLDSIAVIAQRRTQLVQHVLAETLILGNIAMRQTPEIVLG